MLYYPRMKHSKILLLLGLWFFIIPLTGIPFTARKIMLIIPALFLIAMAITAIRSERKSHSKFSETQEELIHEIAEEIAEEITEDANMDTQRELKHLKDIL